MPAKTKILTFSIGYKHDPEFYSIFKCLGNNPKLVYEEPGKFLTLIGKKRTDAIARMTQMLKLSDKILKQVYKIASEKKADKMAEVEQKKKRTFP